MQKPPPRDWDTRYNPPCPGSKGPPGLDAGLDSMGWLKRIMGSKEVAPPTPTPRKEIQAPAPPTAPAAPPRPEPSTAKRAKAAKPKPPEAPKGKSPETALGDPKEAKSYLVRALTRKEKGRLDEAIADLTQAIQLNPGIAQAYFQRGQAQQSKGQLAEAIADYTKAIELKADYAEAYSNRGVLRERKGDTAGAKADYSKSIELEIRGALEREFPGHVPPKGS